MTLAGIPSSACGQDARSVTWLYKSPLTVHEVVTESGGGLRFNYHFTNLDSVGIWTFMTWTKDEPTNVTTWQSIHSDWTVAVWNLDDPLLDAKYDARNLDPGLNWLVLAVPSRAFSSMGLQQDIGQETFDIWPLEAWGVVPDLIIVDEEPPLGGVHPFDDNGYLAASEAIFEKAVPGATFARGWGLADYTSQIDGLFAANHEKLNVIFVGHGSEGQIAMGDGWGRTLHDSDLHMCGSALVGGDPAWNAIRNGFIDAANGKIAHLLLFGCEVAAPPAGLDFLWELADGLGGGCTVSAYNAVVWAGAPFGEDDLGQFSLCDFPGSEMKTIIGVNPVESTTWGVIKAMYR